MIYHPHLSNIPPHIVKEHTSSLDVTIHSHVWIGDKVVIPSGVKIQAFAFIPNGVILGTGVFIGPHVCFTNDKNPPHGDWKQTVVGTNVAIGAGSVILPGVTIGEYAVIGAGSVVTKDVPAGETWFGNPAKKYESSQD